MRRTTARVAQLTQPAPAPAPALLDRTVKGTPTEVATMIATAQATGVLVWAGRPRSISDTEVWVRVRVRAVAPVRAPQAPQRPAPARVAPVPRWWPRRRTTTVVATVVTSTAVVLACVGYVVVQVVQVIHAVAAALHTIVGGLVVLLALLLLLLGLGRAGVCPGIHCPGCPHRH